MKFEKIDDTYVYDLREIDHSKILIVGDIHHAHKEFNTFIEDQQPSLVLQVGDFSYFPNIVKYDESFKKINSKAPIIFCGGNHDNWDYLDAAAHSGSLEVHNNVFYAPKNTILFMKDNMKALMVGGAKSNDVKRRTMGYDWFHQEELKERDYYKSPNERIDIIISHTGPSTYTNKVLDGLPSKFKYNDFTEKVLEEYNNKYNPSYWFFGHMHTFRQGYDESKKCHWACLNSHQHQEKNRPMYVQLEIDKKHKKGLRYNVPRI